jgi:hypothetical protein
MENFLDVFDKHLSRLIPRFEIKVPLKCLTKKCPETNEFTPESPQNFHEKESQETLPNSFYEEIH